MELNLSLNQPNKEPIKNPIATPNKNSISPKAQNNIPEQYLIESYYKDDGSIKKSNESILIIKTFLSKNKVENLIKNTHPYDIPFVIQLETKKVNRKYLSWALQTHKS